MILVWPDRVASVGGPWLSERALRPWAWCQNAACAGLQPTANSPSANRPHLQVKDAMVKVSDRSSFVCDLMECTVDVDRRMLDYISGAAAGCVSAVGQTPCGGCRDALCLTPEQAADWSLLRALDSRGGGRARSLYATPPQPPPPLGFER